jgi:hypothetical protein
MTHLAPLNDSHPEAKGTPTYSSPKGYYGPGNPDVPMSLTGNTFILSNQVITIQTSKFEHLHVNTLVKVPSIIFIYEDLFQLLNYLLARKPHRKKRISFHKKIKQQRLPRYRPLGFQNPHFFS